MQSDSGQMHGLYERCPLLHILADKQRALSISLSEWDLVVRQARSLDFLAALYVHLADIIEQLPEAPVRHMRWAHTLTQRHKQSIMNEVDQLATTLAPLNTPIVLLKGAAYRYSELSPAEGRLFSDIDILLPEVELKRAELLLENSGWLATHLDGYDQYYYRQWMHELPPLRHGQRQTELDVHHAIVPRTARVTPSSQAMLEQIVAIDSERNLYRLGNADIVLHSATHLFFDGEFKHGLRDLCDIDRLLRELCKTELDWKCLIERAEQQDLSTPLFYALYYCTKWLNTPVPESIKFSLPGSFSNLRASIMSGLFDRGLLPDHISCYDPWTQMARRLLYLRSHYLKMPMHLLIPHLAYKSCIAPLVSKWEELMRKEKPNTLEQLLEEKKARM